MKGVIVSVVLFIVMIIAIAFSISYLNMVSSNLQKLNDEIEQYVISDKWDKAYNTSVDYSHKYEKYSKSIKPFVNHQEIDNIETELSKLPQYVKEKTKDEALASIHVLKFYLNHIADLEKINIQNIF